MELGDCGKSACKQHDMTTSPRIAIYLPSLHGGGAERVMVTLANGFAERALAVDLVMAKAEGPYLADVSSNVRVLDLGARSVGASLPALVRYLRRDQPSAMLSAMIHANVIALLARHLAGVNTRVVVSERAHFSESKKNESSRRGRVVFWLARHTYPWADGVVAVSAGVADDLARTIGLPRASIDVVYNPVVTEDLVTRAAAPLDHPWFARGAPPVVLGVGRLTAQKGFDVLLHAFARVHQARPARLMILGEGELRPRLEALACELGVQADVALPGFQQNPFPYMRRAGVFALSSRFEGLPNALIQAMACGTPVVSTDCPSGPAEILEHGRWGRLVPVGDALSFAAAISAAIDDTVHPDVCSRASDFDEKQSIGGYLKAML